MWFVFSADDRLTKINIFSTHHGSMRMFVKTFVYLEPIWITRARHSVLEFFLWQETNDCKPDCFWCSYNLRHVVYVRHATPSGIKWTERVSVWPKYAQLKNHASLSQLCSNVTVLTHWSLVGAFVCRKTRPSRLPCPPITTKPIHSVDLSPNPCVPLI